MTTYFPFVFRRLAALSVLSCLCATMVEADPIVRRLPISKQIRVSSTDPYEIFNTYLPSNKGYILATSPTNTYYSLTYLEFPIKTSAIPASSSALFKWYCSASTTEHFAVAQTLAYPDALFGLASAHSVSPNGKIYEYGFKYNELLGYFPNNTTHEGLYGVKVTSDQDMTRNCWYEMDISSMLNGEGAEYLTLCCYGVGYKKAHVLADGSGCDHEAYVELTCEVPDDHLSTLGVMEGYKCYYDGFSRMADSQTSVYVARRSAEGNTVRLARIASGHIPANTPVVLKSECGNAADGYTMSLTAVSDVPEAETGDNLLRVSDGITPLKNVYRLGYRSPDNPVPGIGVGFYLYSDPDEGPLTAGIIYLDPSELDQATSTSSLRMDLGEESDMAIQTVEGRTSCYDLNGRQGASASDAKGFVVVGNALHFIR